MRNNDNIEIDRHTMASLQNVLLHTNQYKQLFYHAYEIIWNTPSTDLTIRIVADPSTDLCRYNAPTVDEVAVIIPGNHSLAPQPCNIVLHNHAGHLSFIHDHHLAYVPMHYVLLFPFGTQGWTYGIPQRRNTQQPNSSINEKHVTQVQYYSFRLHIRQNEFPILQHSSCLFQQYVCDMGFYRSKSSMLDGSQSTSVASQSL